MPSKDPVKRKAYEKMRGQDPVRQMCVFMYHLTRPASYYVRKAEYAKENKAKIKAYQAKYRASNHEKHLKYCAAYHKTNLEERKAADRAYHEAHKQQRKEYTTTPRYKALRQAERKTQSVNLTDRYVAGVLRWSVKQCPKALIELKRTQLMLHRAAKETE